MSADFDSAPALPDAPADVRLQELVAAVSAAVTAHAVQAGHVARLSLHGRAGVEVSCSCHSRESVRPPELGAISRLARAWEAAHLAETGHGVWRHIRGLDDLNVLCLHPSCGGWPPLATAVVGSPAGRAAALADFEHALALALQAMADNDCCADPDDPDWRGPAVEQFRADLRALGVSDQELDTAGIRYTPDVVTVPQHRLREAGL